MRIAMLTNNYLPFVGGVPISIKRLADGLRELGHMVYIFAPTYGSETEEEYVIRYHSLPFEISNGCVVPDIMDQRIYRAFENYDFDIIHVHHPILAGDAAQYLGRKYGIPVIYTYHTRYEQYLHYIKPYHSLQLRYTRERNALLRRVEGNVLEYSESTFLPRYIRFFSNRCDMVFAPSLMMRELLQEQGVTTRIELLPTGLEQQFYRPDEKKAEEIRRSYARNAMFLFCTVSRLEEEKNISFLIRSMQVLKSKYTKDFRLLIIGDGTKRKVLETEAKMLDLKEQVVFLGTIPQTEIKNYYKACDLFLFASKSETQGIVLLEAMAASLPVVAVSASGVNDIVVQNENGRVTTETEEEFADTVKEVVSNVPKYNAMKQHAINTAYEYSCEVIAKQAEQYYIESIMRKEEEHEKKRKRRNRQKDYIPDHAFLS